MLLALKYNNMSDKDKELVNKAYATNDWGEADNLMNEAESAEAKNTIRCIRNYLYHKEEYFGGVL